MQSLLFLNPNYAYSEDLGSRFCPKFTLQQYDQTISKWEEMVESQSCISNNDTSTKFIAFILRELIEEITAIGGDPDQFLPICNKHGELISLAHYDLPPGKDYLNVSLLLSKPGSKGGGRTAILQLFQIGRQEHKTQIHVKSLNSAVNFYEKMGFYVIPKQGKQTDSDMVLPLTYADWKRINQMRLEGKLEEK